MKHKNWVLVLWMLQGDSFNSMKVLLMGAHNVGLVVVSLYLSGTPDYESCMTLQA